MKNDIIKWIQSWYISECNGDWEHTYGITIETIDNPGWSVTIDLKETEFVYLEIENQTVENKDDDWYSFKVEDSKYEAFGDPSKLELILNKFKEIISNTRN